MSTAEQIIAAHPLLTTNPGRGVCRCGTVVHDYDDYAAHVVAALTNAGHEIVELPEASSVTQDNSDDLDFWTTTQWSTALAYVSVFDPDGGDGPAIFLRTREGATTPGQMRELAAALLAAARVAEGGGR